jgi:hypothetical protein
MFYRKEQWTDVNGVSRSPIFSNVTGNRASFRFCEGCGSRTEVSTKDFMFHPARCKSCRPAAPLPPLTPKYY